MDLGCAGGRIAQYLSAHFPQVYAIDRDHQLLEAAAAKSPEIRFVCGDFLLPETWSLMAVSFDLIVANCALRKDYCDIDHIAGFCHQYLNPGGAIIIRVQAFKDLQHLIPWERRSRLFYQKDELREAFSQFRLVGLAEEHYLQKFSTVEYISQFLERTNLPPCDCVDRLEHARCYHLFVATK